jgi:response regulator RpfG family c-di-GMP phosphodiesterase
MALKYKHRMLLVDDEASIISSLQRAFRREPYETYAASCGEEALKQLKEAEKPFSIIISDQRMPGMTGAEFLEKSKDFFPNAIRILLTGYSDADAIIDAVNKGEIHRYITKAWNDEDLLRVVRSSLAEYELRLENKRLLALTRRQNRKLKELTKHLQEKVEERSREIIEKNKELSCLNQELESSFYNTVRSFGSMAEIVTPALAPHGRRVGVISRKLAEHLGLPDGEVTHTEIAGLLHDIGKLGLPSKLLDYKEGKWSDQDRALFNKHPEQGQATFQFIKKLDHVGVLIRCHHERYDGRGYPDQLAEEEIPLGARIIGVADAYDKIVNLKVDADSAIKRVAKEANTTQDHLGEDEVLRKAGILYLREQAFTRYDPDVVKAFLGLLKSQGIEYGREKAIPIEQLQEGMTLSKSLCSSSGRLLFPYSHQLTKNDIDKVKTFHGSDPITDTIYVVGSMHGNQ